MGNFFQFLKDHFWHALPILVAGSFAIAIIAERVRALFYVYPIQNVQGFFDKLTEYVLAGKIGEAIALCDRFPEKPTAVIAKQALLRAHQPEPLIEQGIALAVGEATQRVQRRTSFLATIANVATLLGLFGTIAGLIHSFEAVGHADAQQKSALLAAGISEAMNATMLGLGVAIPCMVGFAFLINRTNRLIGDIDHSAVKVLDVLKQRYYAAESEALNPLVGGQPDADDDRDETGALPDGKKASKVAALRRVA